MREEPLVNMPLPSYRQHRCPAEIIAQCVRLSFRLPRSDRGVAEMMVERGVMVSYATIRRGCHTFGPLIAAEIRRRRPQPKDTWPRDAMPSTMQGKTYSLWRAGDAAGMVRASLVQERRNQEAAATVLRRVGEAYRNEPRVAVTDKLASAGPARKTVLPRTEHRTHKGLNKRAETAHQPTRQRERAMRRLKLPQQAQRFGEPFGPMGEHFCPGRQRLPAQDDRAVLAVRFATWPEVTGMAA